MPDESTMICHCRNITLGKLATYIKNNDVQKYQQIIEDATFSCGDSCEACHEDGYDNDGLSLAMAVGMVKKGYI